MPEPEFIIAFSLNGIGGAILETVRLLPNRRFDRDSKVWKAPWSAAPQIKALAEQYAFDVTPEAKVMLDAVQKIAPIALPRAVALRAGQLEFTFPYDAAIVTDIKTIPGRRWDGERKVWVIPSEVAETGADILEALIKRHGFNADIEVSQYLRRAAASSVAQRQASRSLESHIDLPVKGLYPFQIAGVEYALKTKRLIIGDPVGLGKSVQALTTIETANAYPVLFICKPTARWQMQEEVAKWLPRRRSIVLSGEATSAIEPADVVICPWSILDVWTAELTRVPFKSAIIDESHMAKERDAKRTKAVKTLTSHLEYRIALTATDVKSRPSELISQLEIIGRLGDLGGWHTFVTRYCSGFKDTFGWNVRGASNIEELHERMRAVCYLRREKSDVLTELPPVQYSVVPLDMKVPYAYKRAEADVVSWLGERAEAKAAMKGLSQWEQRAARRSTEAKAANAERLVRFGALKQVAAQQKIDATIEWLYDFLAGSSDQKIIVFTDFRETTERVAKEFMAPAIYGGISDRTRENARKSFQDDPATRILVANYMSAGESLTLTAAQHVAFVGLPWTPADVDQAIGRAYGRLSDIHGLVAHWLIARGTIEEYIVEMLGTKRHVTSKLVSGREAVASETAMLDALTSILEKRAA